MRRFFFIFILAILTAISTILVGCRKDEMLYVLSSSQEQVTEGVATSEYMGFFVLCEGNMGSNKSTLDYFDYASGIYHRNIYAERNPNVARELGDVGNDLKVYGERLYAVINGSNLVEVMELSTAKHIGEVAVAGGRFIAFDEEYGYVSSYAGAIIGDARLGKVIRFSLATLTLDGECEVGYQPEQMVVLDGKLYVANSGGYKGTGGYDNRLSVIDLATFTKERDIEVAENLFGVVLSSDNKIYVSAWGNDSDQESATYIVDPSDYSITPLSDLSNTKMSIANDQIYILSGEYGAGFGYYTLFSTLTQQIIDDSIIDDDSQDLITQPHSIAANPETGEFFVTDAKDYVTPGSIIAYDSFGYRQWKATTGDIPSAIAFTHTRLLSIEDSNIEEGDGNNNNSEEEKDEEVYSIDSFTNLTAVVDYSPAPGTYVTYEESETAFERLSKYQYVSLGAWGGSITVEFEGDVLNREGADIAIMGNQFATSNEPGIVWVLSDEIWYELKGSEFESSVRNHSKSYDDGVTTLYGTLLPSNVVELSSGYWSMGAFEWGYVDNTPTLTSEVSGSYTLFEIDNAVDSEGEAVGLNSIQQVKIQCGVDATAGILGEVSTEVLHIKARTKEPE